MISKHFFFFVLINEFCSTDDSWINVTPDQVDEMMASAGGFPAAPQGREFDLSKISQSMANFVEHESGIDGAEFPK